MILCLLNDFGMSWQSVKSHFRPRGLQLDLVLSLKCYGWKQPDAHCITQPVKAEPKNSFPHTKLYIIAITMVLI